jgi:hypothetical protein
LRYMGIHVRGAPIQKGKQESVRSRPIDSGTSPFYIIHLLDDLSAMH